jgi:hypothetical protein
MSSSPPFTSEQVNEISRLLEQNNSRTVEAVQNGVAAAITSQQLSVIESAKTRIADAVNANQKVFLATVQNAAGQETSATESKWWKLLLALLPAMLPTLATLFIGYAIWQRQTQIQKGVDEGKVILTSHLAMKEEFFKRKLTVYENVHSQITRLVAELNTIEVDPKQDEAVAGVLSEFNDSLEKSRFYINDNTHDALDQLREYGLRVLSKEKGCTTGEFMNKVVLVEKMMATDLDVNDMGHIVKPDDSK